MAVFFGLEVRIGSDVPYQVPFVFDINHILRHFAGISGLLIFDVYAHFKKFFFKGGATKKRGVFQGSICRKSRRRSAACPRDSKGPGPRRGWWLLLGLIIFFSNIYTP